MKNWICLLGLASLALWAKAPEWVTQPQKSCSSRELCAVGEAVGRTLAEAKAREALAKYFSTQINSQTTLRTGAESRLKDDVVEGMVQEDVDAVLRETSEEVLKGVEIKQVYQDTEGVYALASIDTRVAARRLKEKIKQLDVETEVLVKDDRRSSLYRALKNLVARRQINNRHDLLVKTRVPSPFSYRELYQRWKNKSKKHVTIYLAVKEVSGLGEVEHLLITELLRQDYRVVTDASKKYNLKIEGIVQKHQEHMNVKGFEKYKFLLKVLSYNQKKEKVGALEFSTTETGRNLTHAYQQALGPIKNYLAENLSQLTLD